MERLNSILGRTMPRRPHEAPPTSGNPSRGPRQSAPSPSTSQTPTSSTTRRPLPEQTARLGGNQPGSQPRSLPPQAYLRNAHAAQQQRSDAREAYTQRPRTTQEYQRYGEGPTTRPPYTRQPPADVAPSHHSARPRPKQDVQRFQPMPSLPPDDYYHTDDHSPALPADVYSDQNLTEEEDVARSMLYGDYLDDEDENEGGYEYEEDQGYFEDEDEYEEEAPVYQREDMVQLPAPRGSANRYPQVTREVPALPPIEAHPRPTRDLRSIAQAQLQAPQQQSRYHRTTQPLHPQMVAEMQRARELASEPPSPQPQQHLSRPIASREQQSKTPGRFTAIPAASTTAPAAAKSVCPRCKGAGYLRLNVPFGHPNFGKPIACECKEAERKEKRRQQLREMSNLDAHHSQTFKTFNWRVPGVKEGFHISEAYAQNPDGWLLLIGQNGCGKTHLAASIANQSLDNGSVVLFSVVPDLLDHLRAAFAPNATEVYDQLFSKMREAEVLVLDDMGSQQSSPWANEKLFQLLNYRYNLGMPTVITANPRGLQGIDERIRSRLADVSLVQAIHLDRARDYRPNHPRRRD